MKLTEMFKAFFITVDTGVNVICTTPSYRRTVISLYVGSSTFGLTISVNPFLNEQIIYSSKMFLL